MIALSFLELTEDDGFWHAYVLNSCDVTSPAQLQLKQDGLYAGQESQPGQRCTGKQENSL